MLFTGSQNAFVACLREQPDCFMQLMDLASRALRARAWFARHVPCRYQPLPLVHYDEQEKIMCSGDFHRHLTVHYAHSLQRQNFDYLRHPSFYDYGLGVMAHPDGRASYLWDDKDLLLEFPPKPLPGLYDGVHWRPVTAAQSHDGLIPRRACRPPPRESVGGKNF